MDPVSVALLGALAGGMGGEAGRQAWAGLTALMGRPFQRGDADGPAASSGEAELVALQEAPADQARAQALSAALAVRAALDAGFRGGLEGWHAQAPLVRTGDGTVSNSISGGTFHGPQFQGRDYSGLSFTTMSPPPPAAPPPGEPDAGMGLPPAQG
ncbi:hypothetical protein ABZ864_45170 [Streptomyces sp. NPDC047082]|uniref:hypothetical protein n=1 Tax=Streptomyces sp. NPDC047082 TaxID=3155259 RepID=UPI0033CC0520